MSPKSNDLPFSFPAPSTFAASVSNPFLAPPPVAAPAEDAVWSQDMGEDVEDGVSADAVDVRVLWGTNVLHFLQMSPPRAFTVGELGSDFVLPEGPGGADGPYRLVVLRDDRPSVLVAPTAKARMRLASGAMLSLPQCIEKGIAVRSGEQPGAYELQLPHGATAAVTLEGSELLFEVTRARAGRVLETGFLAGTDLSGHVYTGLSALVHATLLGALAFFLPGMHGEDAEAIDRDAAAAMQPYLDAIAEKEPEHLEAIAELEAAAPSGGGRGSQAAGPSGTMGSSVAAPSSVGRYALRGDAPDPKLARERTVAEAQTFGMVGLLNTDTTSSANTPIAPWGENTAVGRDASNALGSMWAPSIGDAWGADGLGMSGTGEGGGGLANGVGIRGIGSTVGHGSGDWPGDGPGSGPGHDYGPGGHGGRGGLRAHIPGPPTVRETVFTANGTLPREVVQRVVRQNFGRFRLCYEGGLRTNPGLTGRVAVAFVIARDGSVAVASADRSTDMADPTVTACVVRGFQNLSFPAPKDGLVQVIYPLMLAPGE
jgi:hypothetical protein